ncbi:MAG: outer rane efflux protein [Myxococcaceae bacterium]|nr:outer rane efflux protein [Myxococcaceae bacterium]
MPRIIETELARDEFSASRRKRCGRVLALAAATVCSLSVPARALQPLDVFVERAQKVNTDVRVSTALHQQRDAEADRATGSLLPSLQAQGNYTRNQYQVEFPGNLLGAMTTTPGVPPPPAGNIVVLPHNQLDATFTASVPLIDVGAWERRAVAQATNEVARADLSSMRLDVARRVSRSYFQLLANEAVLQSAQRALQLSSENMALTTEKRDGGTASELDVQRARGDVARAEQDVAVATLNVAISRRSLETLSGIAPEPASEFPSDDLAPEAPLASFLEQVGEVPAVQSARASRRAAERGARAANAAWLPTLSGNFQERVTNAPSLTLHNYYYLAQLQAQWRLDATIPANVRALQAQAAGAMARADAARRQVDDAIFNDWHQVTAAISRARSARTQVEAASAAVTLARDRYEGGIATQLDVLQAQQDLFRADVGRIQADADVAYARTSLRLDIARPIGDRPR